MSENQLDKYYNYYKKVYNQYDKLMKLQKEFKHKNPLLDFKIKKENIIELFGSCYQASLRGKFEDIIQIFGWPCYIGDDASDDRKVFVEWVLEFPSEQICTIYNYKNGYNYMGENGISVFDMEYWSVGGHNYEVINELKRILENTKIKSIKIINEQ